MSRSRFPRLLLPLVPLAGLGCASPLSPTLVEIGRYPTGREPAAVAVADLDGDGRLDAAVANQVSGDVSVFLGQSAGRFSEASGSPFAAGPNPNDLAVADFDGDGAPDLALANHDSDRVTVLLARAGGWVPAAGGPLIVGVRPHPHGIAAGDLDGDGRPDLVLDSFEDDSVHLFWGDGAGGFRAGPVLRVGDHPYHKVRLADVDASGTLDVLTANLRGGDVTVILGDGKGGFQPAPGSPFAAGDAPFAVAAGDFEGDNAPDLAVASSASNSTGRGRDGLILLRGDGHGGFAPFAGSVEPLPTGAAPVAVAACDLDGDGRDEAITADYNGGGVTTASWREAGAVTHTRSVGSNPEALACADLDGDGREEMLVVLGGDDALVILGLTHGQERRTE